MKLATTLTAAVMLVFNLLPTYRIGLAQSESSPWSQPVNLSHSGSASNPHLVIDASQTMNIVWGDEFSGLIHTQRVGDSWLKPAPVALPFSAGLSNLILLPDEAGMVHAAWIDDRGNLYYSRVMGTLFATPGSWSRPLLLGISIVDLDLNIDPEGRLHLAYLRSSEARGVKAGVYYRSKEVNSTAWTVPNLIYASLYFRGLDASSAQVAVAGNQDGNIFLTWDETPQDRLFLARSSDRGKTWSSPDEVDRRSAEDSQSTSGPSRPSIGVLGDKVLLVWQAGHSSADCSMYYRWSGDSGVSWQEAGLLPAPFQESCALESQLLPDAQGSNIRMLLAAAEDSYLTEWRAEGDQEQWSTPSQEAEASAFTNPENFRQVTLGSRQAVLEGETLHVVGSDTGQSSDVWLLSRSLQPAASLAPTPAAAQEWSDPAAIASAATPFSSPTLLADTSNRLHAFWSQDGSDQIYYALWDGVRWTPAIPILLSPGGAPTSLSAAAHPAGLLFLTWSDPLSGELFLSSSPLNEATNPSSWVAPQLLPTGGMSGEAPQAAVSPDGRLNIAYSVPINEGRGVHLLSTSAAVQLDQPVEWLPASVAFDAASAGWEVVGEARLAISSACRPTCPQGMLHLLWERKAASSQALSRGLYATRSLQPAGESLSWEPAVEVTGGQVSWHTLLSAPDEVLHRAWQDNSGSEVLWHQYSPDGGGSWSQQERITGSQSGGGVAGLAIDTQEQLNLLQLNLSFDNGWYLQRWTWQGGQTWFAGGSQPLPNVQEAAALALSSLPDGSLAALLEVQLIPEEPGTAGEEGENALLFSRSQTGNSTPIATTPVTFTPQEATSDPELVLTPALEPTPTLEFSSLPPAASISGLDPRVRSLLLGAVPAVAFFIFFVFLILRRDRR